ncbi:hypothetical protein PFICI_04786 [Pestalotiopsis fici W106-1]|uniref:Methyltransferase domain-containing protein n=1 Tax=Pestalotiopsis fici (strain W106-1 / CGMCC3.15140) TaxID=1229662 RepID=W3XA22_PESFW|nr:uncharacterized protein PFICI_04786 [Pestalotiopsis fici W106-1]ETS82910.1 hypothetical protein PFICI_04786 [Pestalotiopsis fici W106-1]
MATFDTVKEEYNAQAKAYNDEYPSLPYGQLEIQLFGAALGDATGQTVLDLGGGTGLRARQALEAGAASVDVVDISAEMLNVGKDIERELGRDKTRWFEADASKPLDRLGLLPGQYDIVMANWLFDHAENEESLDGMWKNIDAHLKPGGRFVGIRSGDPRSDALSKTDKYGIRYTNIQDIPGGVSLRFFMGTNPPINFDAKLVESSYSGSTKYHTKYGLEDVQLIPAEEMPSAREDPDFWKVFLDNPPMIAVKARKRVE